MLWSEDNTNVVLKKPMAQVILLIFIYRFIFLALLSDYIYILSFTFCLRSLFQIHWKIFFYYKVRVNSGIVQ